MDLSSFPTGRQILGGVPFLIAENPQQQARAIGVRSANTPALPGRVHMALAPDRYTSLIFLHTCHFDFEEKDMHRDLNARYIVTYEDGSTQKIQLVNDENIMAWAPALTRFDAANDNLWLAWTGMTEDHLPSAVYGYRWENPLPHKAIKSIDLEAESAGGASIFLIALTGIVTPP